MENECVFCKIINNNEGSYKLFESDNIIAILDKYPINTGHILILPKIHTNTIVDISSTIIIKMMNLAKKFIKIFEDIFKIDGYTIMQNGGNFCDFGHFHLHIIPRFIGDGFNIGDSDLTSIANEKIANEIISKLNLV